MKLTNTILMARVKFHLEKKQQHWKLLQQFATLEFPIRRSSWIKSLLALATWPYYQRHQVNWLRHFPTTVPQTRKSVTLTCFHWIRLVIHQWLRGNHQKPRLADCLTCCCVVFLKNMRKVNLWTCGNWCLGAVHGCVLPYVPGASFSSTCGSCKLYMWMLDKHSRNGNLSRHQQGSIPDHSESWHLVCK